MGRECGVQVMRRADDEFGFVRRNWVILGMLATFIAGYSALSWSVKNHHDVDEVRDTRLQTDIAQDQRDIAALKEIVKAIPRIEGKVDDILERMPRTHR